MVNPLKAPIPGQSLTGTPGGSPWEHPPRFTDVDEALEYLEAKLMSKKNLTQLLILLKSGVSAEAAARTILLAGFMNGLWNVDLILLMAPIAMYMITGLAQAKGIKVKVRNEDKAYNKFLDKYIERSNAVKKEEEPLEITKSFSILKGFE